MVATPKQKLTKRLSDTNWSLVGGLSFFVAVLLSLVIAYYQVIDYLKDKKQVPLRHVVITGVLKHTSEAQVTDKVLTDDLGSFFSVDVNNVQARIESLPWVYSVSVRKKWPDILNVHISEQQTAAIWNDDQLLNKQGQLFEVPMAQLPQGVVKLYGPQGSEKDALKGYTDLNSLLSINGFDVAELSLSARFSWRLKLNNGVLLELGTQQRVTRVQRFIDMYTVISKHKSQPVVSVDLRYDTGMAVRWAQQLENEKNS